MTIPPVESLVTAIVTVGGLAGGAWKFLASGRSSRQDRLDTRYDGYIDRLEKELTALRQELKEKNSPPK